MTSVEWNDSLQIGIPLIDDQHRTLIDRLNDVSEAIEGQQGEREIVKTLGFLSEYADFHFSAEEKHMEAHEYPGLELQQKKHREFTDMVAKLERDFEEEGSTKALAESINTFLANWLTHHIQGMDLQFGDFLSEKGVSLPTDS